MEEKINDLNTDLEKIISVPKSMMGKRTKRYLILFLFIIAIVIISVIMYAKLHSSENTIFVGGSGKDDVIPITLGLKYPSSTKANEEFLLDFYYGWQENFKVTENASVEVIANGFSVSKSKADIPDFADVKYMLPLNRTTWKFKKPTQGTEISLKWLGETNKGEIQFIFHMNGSGMGKIIRVYYYIDNDKIVFTKDTYEHELLSHNKRVIVN